MPLHGVQAVFVVVLMFATTVKMDEAKVDFWRKDVTVKCPNNADLYKSNEKVDNKFEYNEQIQLECKDSPKPYLIFIKGRACQNCFELDGQIFIIIIIGDLIGTGVVILIIYRCSKKKSQSQTDKPHKPSKPTKPTSRQGGRAPPVPGPDYESLNIHTMSDTYSTMNNSAVTRTG